VHRRDGPKPSSVDFVSELTVVRADLHDVTVEQREALVSMLARTPPLPDHLAAELRGSTRVGSGVAFAAVDGAPVALAVAVPANHSVQIDAVTVPSQRTLRARLLGELLGTIAPTTAVTWWATTEPADRSVADALGLEEGRSLLQMSRPLPGEHHTDIVTRQFVPGVDDEAWLRVNNAAFSWHPEQGGWTLDTLQRRLAQPWVDLDGFLVHDRNGVLSAFCWVKLHDDAAGVTGEIYIVAVHPGSAGHGLGKAMTIAGLQWMTTRGAVRAQLYVDRDNTSAVRLYESLGFVTTATQQAYVRKGAPS
jgi:mycothiol synthase